MRAYLRQKHHSRAADEGGRLPDGKARWTPDRPNAPERSGSARRLLRKSRAPTARRSPKPLSPILDDVRLLVRVLRFELRIAGAVLAPAVHRLWCWRSRRGRRKTYLRRRAA